MINGCSLGPTLLRGCLRQFEKAFASRVADPDRFYCRPHRDCLPMSSTSSWFSSRATRATPWPFSLATSALSRRATRRSASLEKEPTWEAVGNLQRARVDITAGTNRIMRYFKSTAFEIRPVTATSSRGWGISLLPRCRGRLGHAAELLVLKSRPRYLP